MNFSRTDGLPAFRLARSCFLRLRRRVRRTRGSREGGFDLISDSSLPGTSGLPSIAQIAAGGHTVLTF
jgi:hypothetical protein